jgi:hypothetical protein
MGNEETAEGGCTLILLSNECTNDENDCDDNADCTDTVRSYTCACPEFMIDADLRNCVSYLMEVWSSHFRSYYVTNMIESIVQI